MDNFGNVSGGRDFFSFCGKVPGYGENPYRDFFVLRQSQIPIRNFENPYKDFRSAAKSNPYREF